MEVNGYRFPTSSNHLLFCLTETVLFFWKHFENCWSLVVINFHNFSHWFQWLPVSDIFQIIFFCAQQRQKETNKGLKDIQSLSLKALLSFFLLKTFWNLVASTILFMYIFTMDNNGYHFTNIFYIIFFCVQQKLFHSSENILKIVEIW